VRTFASFDGVGLHLLASDEPLVGSSANGLAARLPPPAASDLVEWGPGHTPAEQFATVLSQEQSPADLVPAGVRGLTDDHPVNEYYFLRRGGWR
jgi:hypothetical protein